MKMITVIGVLILSLHSIIAQDYYFPPIEGTEWETVSPESLGWCTGEIDTLLEFLDENNSKAFILLQDGKIALEHYFGSFSQDSIWYWASAGKTLTAFLTGLSQEEGFLDIGDPSSDYLGDGWTSCPPDKEALITVHHQLTMTSGLDDGVEDPYCTLDTCLQYLSAAGTRWAYHNAPYTLLESVVEESTGMNYNSYLYSRVNNKTGMTGLFLPSGYNKVYFSNARSMARFGLLILNNGVWDNDSVMTDTAYFHDMVNTSQPLNLSYGYLWWLNGKESFMLPGLQYVFPGMLFPDAPPDMFAAMGKNGQIINVVPSMGLVFIRMGNTPEGSIDITPIFNNQIWQLLNKIICNVGLKDPKTNINPEEIALYPNPAGEYIVFKSSRISGNYMYQVIDFSGKTIISGKNENRISTGHLPDGVYLLRLICGPSVMSKYFIKKIRL
jgi:CubicO group peptidase (beta-lactamase class C family)